MAFSEVESCRGAASHVPIPTLPPKLWGNYALLTPHKTPNRYFLFLPRAWPSSSPPAPLLLPCRPPFSAPAPLAPPPPPEPRRCPSSSLRRHRLLLLSHRHSPPPPDAAVALFLLSPHGRRPPPPAFSHAGAPVPPSSPAPSSFPGSGASARPRHRQFLALIGSMPLPRPDLHWPRHRPPPSTPLPPRHRRTPILTDAVVVTQT